MENKYKFKLSFKTQFLNVLRQMFKQPSFEKFLVGKTLDKSPDSFWSRICPPNYLYSKNTNRRVNRHGIEYDLDISDYLEHSVYFGFSDSASDRLLSYAKTSKVIIDVGVNIGLTALNFAKVAPDSIIFGFEPDIDNITKARKNNSINNFDNIKFFHKGLGESNTKGKLSRVNKQNAGMNRILPENAVDLTDEYESTEIEIISFDDFAEEQNLSSIDLIKIDVEGYEFKVLKGAVASIERFHPTLFIEIDDNNLREQDSSAQELLKFLESFGYEFYRADNDQKITFSESFDNCHFDVICLCKPKD